MILYSCPCARAPLGFPQDGEMREVSVELEADVTHPILLVKTGGDISALGAKCTHYQYPLAKGVLCKGIIRCPLHGACFNAKVRSGACLLKLASAYLKLMGLLWRYSLLFRFFDPARLYR